MLGNIRLGQKWLTVTNALLVTTVKDFMVLPPPLFVFIIFSACQFYLFS
jgi:hypothetical protein